LDGGHVLEMIAPPQMREGIRRVAPFGILIVLGLLWLTPIFGILISGFFSAMNWLIVLGFGDGFATYLWS
jgi:Zn-dependent protease